MDKKIQSRLDNTVNFSENELAGVISGIKETASSVIAISAQQFLGGIETGSFGDHMKIRNTPQT